MNPNAAIRTVLAIVVLGIAASCAQLPHSADPAAVSPPPAGANAPSSGALGSGAPSGGTIAVPAPGARRVADRRSDGTTIAPMPVPGEDSAATQRRQMLNLPKVGEYVYITNLPEAISKVPPGYPEAARKAGIQGIVMVQALVLADGTVGEAHVISSIPMLDDPAVAAVRQWRFKPAMNEQTPVAVWVGVPVKFTLH